MVFVADDLGAWLIGLLADAGRRKLASMVLSTDQERALRQAATAAVELTAKELAPADSEKAAEIAMVVGEVFSGPVLDEPLTARTTMLEVLQAGLAQQLAVLDDPEATGTGQSSASVLGVRAGMIAEVLAGHLVRGILLRGSRGGPLFPLATQLTMT